MLSVLLMDLTSFATAVIKVTPWLFRAWAFSCHLTRNRMKYAFDLFKKSSSTLKQNDTILKCIPAVVTVFFMFINVCEEFSSVTWMTFIHSLILPPLIIVLLLIVADSAIQAGPVTLKKNGFDEYLHKVCFKWKFAFCAIFAINPVTVLGWTTYDALE